MTRRTTIGTTKIVMGLSAFVVLFSGCVSSRSDNSFVDMHITSPAFAHNQRIPSTYTCDGENVSPPFSFSGVPEEAKSLVLISDDPDAPRGTWVHWLVWDMDPKTTQLPEGVDVPIGVPVLGNAASGVPEAPAALEGTTSFGTTGYGGPCPPSGTHRYFFKLYALDIVLGLPTTADKAQLEAAMDGHVIASAELVGLYQR